MLIYISYRRLMRDRPTPILKKERSQSNYNAKRFCFYSEHLVDNCQLNYPLLTVANCQHLRNDRPLRKSERTY
ncbi:MAG: hypothetical protein HC849_06610 [Oscillatoriales cyanobacterium RU_3_3]|nr:hypothetical protein [Oscillatoriales cyanobacterium RU_3_3]